MADETKTSTEPESQPSEDFESYAQEASPGLIAEFWDFLIHNKKWWLTPIILVLLLVGFLVFLSGSVVAPFIYPFF